ncbi:zinc finger homeobox protein 2-like [Pristis pectinata]|uniref:zinc finger homeobox protein 2-like n=1 Tax=Pristis pectinata TaxID=685728 RepID=UPI00223CCCAA|nr:zinc finger homeobox protein 2-like [Pristis pectinata]
MDWLSSTPGRGGRPRRRGRFRGRHRSGVAPVGQGAEPEEGAGPLHPGNDLWPRFLPLADDDLSPRPLSLGDDLWPRPCLLDDDLCPLSPPLLRDLCPCSPTLDLCPHSAGLPEGPCRRPAPPDDPCPALTLDPCPHPAPLLLGLTCRLTLAWLEPLTSDPNQPAETGTLAQSDPTASLSTSLLRLSPGGAHPGPWLEKVLEPTGWAETGSPTACSSPTTGNSLTTTCRSPTATSSLPAACTSPTACSSPTSSTSPTTANSLTDACGLLTSCTSPTIANSLPTTSCVPTTANSLITTCISPIACSSPTTNPPTDCPSPTCESPTIHNLPTTTSLPASCSLPTACRPAINDMPVSCRSPTTCSSPISNSHLTACTSPNAYASPTSNSLPAIHRLPTTGPPTTNSLATTNSVPAACRSPTANSLPIACRSPNTCESLTANRLTSACRSPASSSSSTYGSPTANSLPSVYASPTACGSPANSSPPTCKSHNGNSLPTACTSHNANNSPLANGRPVTCRWPTACRPPTTDGPTTPCDSPTTCSSPVANGSSVSCAPPSNSPTTSGSSTVNDLPAACGLSTVHASRGSLTACSLSNADRAPTARRLTAAQSSPAACRSNAGGSMTACSLPTACRSTTAKSSLTANRFSNTDRLPTACSSSKTGGSTTTCSPSSFDELSAACRSPTACSLTFAKSSPTTINRPSTCSSPTTCGSPPAKNPPASCGSSTTNRPSACGPLTAHGSPTANSPLTACGSPTNNQLTACRPPKACGSPPINGLPTACSWPTACGSPTINNRPTACGPLTARGSLPANNLPTACSQPTACSPPWACDSPADVSLPAMPPSSPSPHCRDPRTLGPSGWEGAGAPYPSHNSCKTLKCPRCNWRYKYRRTLEAHIRDKHRGGVEVSCPHCQAGRPHPRLSRGQAYSCGYRPFCCRHCDYSTTTKGNLSIHMQSDHHQARLRCLGLDRGPQPAAQASPRPRTGCRACRLEKGLGLGPATGPRPGAGASGVLWRARDRMQGQGTPGSVDEARDGAQEGQQVPAEGIADPTRDPQSRTVLEEAAVGEEEGTDRMAPCLAPEPRLQCPLCQETPSDRRSLCFHLTHVHSVVSDCVQRLLLTATVVSSNALPTDTPSDCADPRAPSENKCVPGSSGGDIFRLLSPPVWDQAVSQVWRPTHALQRQATGTDAPPPLPLQFPFGGGSPGCAPLPPSPRDREREGVPQPRRGPDLPRDRFLDPTHKGRVREESFTQGSILSVHNSVSHLHQAPSASLRPRAASPQGPGSPGDRPCSQPSALDVRLPSVLHRSRSQVPGPGLSPLPPFLLPLSTGLGLGLSLQLPRLRAAGILPGPGLGLPPAAQGEAEAQGPDTAQAQALGTAKLQPQAPDPSQQGPSQAPAGADSQAQPQAPDPDPDPAQEEAEAKAQPQEQPQAGAQSQADEAEAQSEMARSPRGDSVSVPLPQPLRDGPQAPGPPSSPRGPGPPPCPWDTQAPEADPGTRAAGLKRKAAEAQEMEGEEEGEATGSQDRRMRTTILPWQLEALNHLYLRDPNPGGRALDLISSQLGLRKRVVQMWFQNSRARERRGAPALPVPVRLPLSPPRPGIQGPEAGGPRRSRTQMSSLQLRVLRACFREHRSPTVPQCQLLGAEIGLPRRVVQVWFQNARAKERKAGPKGGGRGTSRCGVRPAARSHVLSLPHIARLKELVSARPPGPASGEAQAWGHQGPDPPQGHQDPAPAPCSPFGAVAFPAITGLSPVLLPGVGPPSGRGALTTGLPSSSLLRVSAPSLPPALLLPREGEGEGEGRTPPLGGGGPGGIWPPPAPPAGTPAARGLPAPAVRGGEGSPRGAGPRPPASGSAPTGPAAAPLGPGPRPGSAREPGWAQA